MTVDRKTCRVAFDSIYSITVYDTDCMRYKRAKQFPNTVPICKQFMISKTVILFIRLAENQKRENS
jgi:hypothetical protein